MKSQSIIWRAISPYKSHQLWLVRMAFSAGLGIVSFLLVSRVVTHVVGAESRFDFGLQLCTAAVLILIAAVLHNTPGIADFMISTHSEMERVAWPTRRYVINALRVTAVFVLVLVLTVMIIDVFWNLAFDVAGLLVAT